MHGSNSVSYIQQFTLEAALVRPGDTLYLDFEVLGKTTDKRHSDRGYVDFGGNVFTDSGDVMSFVIHNIV